MKFRPVALSALFMLAQSTLSFASSSLTCVEINPHSDGPSRPYDLLKGKITLDFDGKILNWLDRKTHAELQRPLVVSKSSAEETEYGFRIENVRHTFYLQNNPEMIKRIDSDLDFELHYMLIADGPGMHEDYYACTRR